MLSVALSSRCLEAKSSRLDFDQVAEVARFSTVSGHRLRRRGADLRRCFHPAFAAVQPVAASLSLQGTNVCRLRSVVVCLRNDLIENNADSGPCLLRCGYQLILVQHEAVPLFVGWS